MYLLQGSLHLWNSSGSPRCRRAIFALLWFRHRLKCLCFPASPGILTYSRISCCGFREELAFASSDAERCWLDSCLSVEPSASRSSQHRLKRDASYGRELSTLTEISWHPRIPGKRSLIMPHHLRDLKPCLSSPRSFRTPAHPHDHGTRSETHTSVTQETIDSGSLELEDPCATTSFQAF